MALQGNILGCSIYELPLGEDCAPYEMFKMSRFAFSVDDINKVIELAKLCSDLDGLDIEELIEEQSQDRKRKDDEAKRDKEIWDKHYKKYGLEFRY